MGFRTHPLNNLKIIVIYCSFFVVEGKLSILYHLRYKFSSLLKKAVETSTLPIIYTINVWTFTATTWFHAQFTFPFNFIRFFVEFEPKWITFFTKRNTSHASIIAHIRIIASEHALQRGPLCLPVQAKGTLWFVLLESVGFSPISMDMEGFRSASIYNLRL